MKRLLTLLALSSLTFAAACGEDKKDDSSKSQEEGDTQPDAGTGKKDGGGSTTGSVENVGEPCKVSSVSKDCEGKAICLTEVVQLDAEFVGGYCSANCSEHAQCGEGGGCPFGEAAKAAGGLGGAAGGLGALAGGGGTAGMSPCLKRCQKGGDECREGYDCKSIADNVPQLAGFPLARALVPSLFENYCMPPVTLPAFDAGMQMPPPGPVDASTEQPSDAGGGSVDAGPSDAGVSSDASRRDN